MTGRRRNRGRGATGEGETGEPGDWDHHDRNRCGLDVEEDHCRDEEPEGDRPQDHVSAKTLPAKIARRSCTVSHRSENASSTRSTRSRRSLTAIAA